MPQTNDDEILRELKSIKLLLALQLLNSGVKQKQLAIALGVSEATMSRMLPKDKVSRRERSEGVRGDDLSN